MARRPKPPRRRRTEAAATSAAAVSSSATDTRGAGQQQEQDRQPKRQRRIAVGNQVRDRAKCLSADDCDPLPTLQECQDEVPFCCAVCQCSPARKGRVLMRDAGTNNYVPADEEHLWTQPSKKDGLCWHRRCCHGRFDVPDDNNVSSSGNDDEEEEEQECQWAPQYVAAEEELAQEITCEKNNVTDETVLEWVTSKDIHDAYDNTYKTVARQHNEDRTEHPLAKAMTNEKFTFKILAPFKAERERRQKGPRRAAVVLDLFAGIGTGIICLKKQNIAIKRIIHVEHDKVATHVYRSNHDATYSDFNLSSDGIEHVYVDRFEDIEKELYDDSSLFLKKYGPIDIILGGPPCVDFSAINASRKGTAGEQGKYMLQCGKFIRTIVRMQQTMKHSVFFLAENVVTTRKNLDDTCKAFGMDWDPVRVNAERVSPCLRDRHYYTNIPPFLQGLEDGSDGTRLDPKPTCCLDEGFQIPADIVDKDFPSKVPCFLASQSRVDDPTTLRMYVFQDSKKHTEEEGLVIEYKGRPMIVKEREKLMGYPEGYVGKPVSHLFNELLFKGLRFQRRNQPRWKGVLAEKYHHFAGHYHGVLGSDGSHKVSLVGSKVIPEKGGCPDLFGGDRSGAAQYMELLMAPPLEGKKSPSYFDVASYAKHLIGNAYSVPVVEQLLQPLRDMFALREYPGYDYRYAWEETETL